MEAARILLKSSPQGAPAEENFTRDTATLGEPGEGQVLCETLFLSLDPYLRSKIAGRHMSGSTLPGEVMPGEAVSRVLKSAHPEVKEGELLQMHSGWQSHFICDVPKDVVRPFVGELSPSLSLGVLGMPGLTAYAGMTRLAELREGLTVVVSASSGAVGSTVGQIARIKGCRAVGIAGSAEKCAWCVEEAGFAACINYKEEDLREALKKHCPDGIDVYFDNVGGDTLLAVCEQLAVGAQLVLCGLISQYNNPEDQVPPAGPPAGLFIRARATVRGLVVYDHYDLAPTAAKDIEDWIKEGKFHYKEDVYEGLDKAPEAFVRLMSGRNFGKVIVKVA